MPEPRSGWAWALFVISATTWPKSWSKNEKPTARVFARNYGEAGALELFRDRYPLPPVISPHNNYWLWGPGEWDGRVMIIIGGDPEDNAEYFDQVERVGVWDHPYAMPYERGLDISIARGFKFSPPARAWEGLRNFN